jgi:predicted nuclease of restriction endonuclease-like (RecB) superfamily
MVEKIIKSKNATEDAALSHTDLHQAIRSLLLTARAQVRQTVNTAMVQTYWHIGRMIVEDEQGGQKRAAYGKQVLPELAKRLSEEFGAGFDVSNLRNMRQFFQSFPIRDALRLELSWTHYRSLIRIDNPQARDWYAKEAAEQGWSVRALDRQISTLYYERLLSTQDQAKAQLKDEAAHHIAKDAAPDPRDFIRDPYVLEFLGAPAVPALYEKDLEQGLLDQLQTFLLELGKGFAFVARQKHLRVFDEQHRQEGDNPTLGLILCSERNAAVAKYSLLADKAQLFASKYQAVMPTEAELQAELERDRALLEIDLNCK